MSLTYILSMSLYGISLWRSAYMAFHVNQFEFSSPKGHYAQFGWKLLPWKREWSFIWTKVNLLYQQGLSPFWVQSMIPYYCIHVQLGPKTGLAPCAYIVVVSCTSFGHKTGCFVPSWKWPIGFWRIDGHDRRFSLSETGELKTFYALQSFIDLKSKSSIFQRISDI